MMANNNEIQQQKLIYQADDGSFQTEIRLNSDTIWLSQKQMSELFKTTTDNIGLHLKNVYFEGELKESATTEDFSVVRSEGLRKVKRQVKHYNLDAVISVGYRVNSKQGTQFRIWASKVLKDYMMQGYALNERRLTQQTEHIGKLKQTLALFHRAQQKDLNLEEASGLLSVLTEYSNSFVLLNQYDTGNFPKNGLNCNLTKEINEEEALKAINRLKENLMARNEATPLFEINVLERSCLSGFYNEIITT